MTDKIKKWFVISQLGLLVLDIIFILMKVSLDEGNNWNLGWTILGIQIMYTALSFKIVKEDEVAAVLLFGNPKKRVTSGLVLVPWLICSLRKESRLTIQMQIPGEPEEIDKSGLDNRGLLEGKKVLPIRATTGSYEIVKKGIFKDDPALVDGDALSQRMTLEPTAQIRFRIKDIVKFIRNIGSIKAAKVQLRDTAEGVIKSEFAKRTPALIIAHWEDINQTLKTEIGKLVKDDPTTSNRNESWGVVVETAQMLDVDMNKKVNEALSQATEAKIQAKKTITMSEAARTAKKNEGLGMKSFRISEGEALAYARKLLMLAEAEGTAKQGEALAYARKLLLLADAIGTAKLAKIAKTPEGQVVLIVQQAREMFEKAKFSVVPGDGGGLFGTVAGIQELLKRIQGDDTEKEPEPIKKKGGK